MKTILTIGTALSVVALALTPAYAVSLTIGGADGLVSVDSGSSSGGGIGVEVGGDSGLVDVDIGGSGGGSSGGAGSSTGNIVNLDVDDGVTLDLFGRGSNAAARAQVDGNQGGGLTARVDLGGYSDAVVVELFGSDSVASIDIFDGSGAGVDETETGSITPGGTGSGTGVSSSSGGAANLAVRRTAKSCISPDASQIRHLLSRSTPVKSLQSVAAVRIVPIPICPDAKSPIAAALRSDADIAALQAAISADARISGALRPAYPVSHVLAADRSGGNLTVYVY